MNPKLLDLVCNRDRAVAQWDNGNTLTIRRSGAWSLRKGCVEAVLALLDGAQGISFISSSELNGLLFPFEQEVYFSLLRDMRNFPAERKW